MYSQILTLLLICVASLSYVRAQQCPFDGADENKLARCLVRPVSRGGHIGQPPATLPNPLSGLVGHAVEFDKAKLQKYLADKGIDEGSIGGTINQDLTRVLFFVIHDTSSPEIPGTSFPADINKRTWSNNNLANWVSTDVPTHIFVNRIGESRMKANFNVPVRATKYESALDLPSSGRAQAKRQRTGKFVHIELIQPRRKLGPYYDLGPTPGFSQEQLDRLALLYIIASYRSGHWLMPALHASVDADIQNAHDDPQNFDMQNWLNSVSRILAEIGQP